MGFMCQKKRLSFGDRRKGPRPAATHTQSGKRTRQYINRDSIFRQHPDHTQLVIQLFECHHARPRWRWRWRLCPRGLRARPTRFLERTWDVYSRKPIITERLLSNVICARDCIDGICWLGQCDYMSERIIPALLRLRMGSRSFCEPLESNPQPQPASPTSPQIQRPPKPVSLTRQQTFACVAYFESGHIDLDPADLHSVLALCSEDSIFVAVTFLLNPFEQPAPHELRRIVGNIRHPGLSLLVAPEGPRIRNPTNKYNAVTHASYDFKRKNNFRGSPLHSSFTDWRFPLEAGEYRTIDQDVSVVEAVISALDGGRWVVRCIKEKGII